MKSLLDQAIEAGNTEDLIAHYDRIVSGKQAEIRSLARRQDSLNDRIEELQQALDQVASVQDHPTPKAGIRHAKRSRKGRCVALVGLSDWHVGERVDKNKLDGRNEYRPEVAESRAEAVARNAVKLIELNRRESAIDHAVLWLGGDFLTGYLHEELAQTNCLGTMEEAYFALDLLTRVVRHIVQNGGCRRYSVIAQRGNHGRTTKRMQFKNDYETSLETFVYWALRDRLAGLPIDWHIPKSDVFHFEMDEGWSLRCAHGHQIKYRGGVGGISVPLLRWIGKQQQTQSAGCTLIGHFHQFEPAGLFLINGSLKGWDEYAASLGFPYEPPSQLFALYDLSRRRLTTRCPIFCE